MRTPRFLYPDPPDGMPLRDLVPGARVLLPDDASHHARRVLRLRPGTTVALFDGLGHEAQAVLAEAAAGETANASHYPALIVSRGPIDREARVAITLVQALSASEKIDWLVEKCVELGLARLVLAPAQRSVVRLEAGRGARRLERWRDIGIAACGQCGRNRLMEITLAGDLAEALQAGRPTPGRAWLLDPAAPVAVAAALPGGGASSMSGTPLPIVCAVGPEGGFTDEEMALAESIGYARGRLGPRVLRTETAGLVAATALMALEGEYAR